MAGRVATVTREWEDRIRTIVENNPRMGGRRIRTLLEAGWPGENDLPSPRTIDRVIARHQASLPEERIDYRYVFWPESFERGDLRWEAAPSFFELQRWNHRLSPPWLAASADADSPEWLADAKEQTRRRNVVAQSGFTAVRPTVRMVRALHAVTQAAPDGPFDWRYEMASHLTVETARVNRQVEARIAAQVYAGIAVWIETPGPKGEQT